MRYHKNLRLEGDKVMSYGMHVATISNANNERVLIAHGYWSATTSKHINYIGKELGLEVVNGYDVKR